MSIGDVGKFVGLSAGALAVGGAVGFAAARSYDHNPFVGKAAIATTGIAGLGALGIGTIAMLESGGISEIVGDSEGRGFAALGLLGVGLIGGILGAAYASPKVPPPTSRTRIDHG